MTNKLAKPRAAAKSGVVPIGNRSVRKGNPISPVMQKVKSLLPAHKPSLHLEILIDQKEQHCRKLLSGHRTENAEILTRLLQSDMGREVLFALMGDARPEWFVKYRKQLDVNAVRRQVKETLRSLDAVQEEIA